MESDKDRVKAQAYLPFQETLKESTRVARVIPASPRQLVGCFMMDSCTSFFPRPVNLILFLTYDRRPQGFAFVEFYEDYDARRAQEKLDREYIKGRELTVIFAKVSLFFMRVGSSLTEASFLTVVTLLF
jgi:hypothetical protein